MRIKFITTGGTIDKLYFDAKSAYEVGAPQIGDILDGMGVAFDYEVLPLLRKDSLDMTDDDRDLIAHVVESDPGERFVITHGTDTMIDTAKVLRRVSGKVMVLTGALRPARFVGSDAVFNIGAAIAAVQVLSPGVYLAMSGRIWEPEQVQKNRALNRFEATP